MESRPVVRKECSAGGLTPSNGHLGPRDPDALLSQALRRGDLYNWSDAEPLFAEAERYAKDIEKKISRKSIESLQAKQHCSLWRFASRSSKGTGPWF